MIRMNLLSRSSRPTGPKMRVPRGSLSFLINTAAFSSNRMYEPSGRRFSFAVRTMTALTTSPRFTPTPGMASLTVATMMSPMLAYRRPEPPSTRMQRISLAPVLSATRSRDSCWITAFSWDRGELLRLLEHRDQPPALGRGQWAGLHQRDTVTDTGGVRLVVHLHLRGGPHDLAVEPVLLAVFERDHHGLVHLVRDDVAFPDLAVVPDLTHAAP